MDDIKFISTGTKSFNIEGISLEYPNRKFWGIITLSPKEIKAEIKTERFQQELGIYDIPEIKRVIFEATSSNNTEKYFILLINPVIVATSAVDQTLTLILSTRIALISRENILSTNIDFKTKQINKIYINQTSFLTWLGKKVLDYRNDNMIFVDGASFNEYLNIKIPGRFRVYSTCTEHTYHSFKEEDRLTLQHYLAFEFEENKSISEILEIAYRWNILYSLFCGKPQEIKAYKLIIENVEKPVYLYLAGKVGFEDIAHPLNIPFTYREIKDNLENVLTSWYGVSDKELFSMDLFYEGLQIKTIYTAFLSLVKSLEGYANELIEPHFTKEEFEGIKKGIKEQFGDEKIAKSILTCLSFANKNKYPLSEQIYLFIDGFESEIVKSLNFTREEIMEITKYRNIISHNKGAEKYYSLNSNKMLFWTYKLTILLMYILLNKSGIPEDSIKENIKMIPMYIQVTRRPVP